MSGPEFWQTGYGRKFLESDLPRLVDALESIATSLATARPSAVAEELDLAKKMIAEDRKQLDALSYALEEVRRIAEAK